MVLPGRPRVQSRVGSRSSGLAAAHSFPQCQAVPLSGVGRGEMERSSHHSPVTSLSVTVRVRVCA